VKRQPVNVATVARALVLLFNESARVVDPADYQLYTWTDWSKLRPRAGERFIQAVRFRLRVPEVVTLIGYDRLPTAAVTFSRRNIFKRDRYTCQYCGDARSCERIRTLPLTVNDSLHVELQVGENTNVIEKEEDSLFSTCRHGCRTTRAFGRQSDL